jgi:hypothetical protein
MRQILIELVWIVFCFSLAVLSIYLLFSWNTSFHFIDIKILGTRVRFSATEFIISACFLLTFIVYLIKELRYKYQRTPGSAIIVIAATLFVISLSFLSAGWTTYPPLGNLGQQFTFQKYQLGLWILRTLVFALTIIILLKYFKSRALRPT